MTLLKGGTFLDGGTPTLTAALYQFASAESERAPISTFRWENREVGLEEQAKLASETFVAAMNQEMENLAAAWVKKEGSEMLSSVSGIRERLG